MIATVYHSEDCQAAHAVNHSSANWDLDTGGSNVVLSKLCSKEQWSFLETYPDFFFLNEKIGADGSLSSVWFHSGNLVGIKFHMKSNHANVWVLWALNVTRASAYSSETHWHCASRKMEVLLLDLKGLCDSHGGHIQLPLCSEEHSSGHIWKLQVGLNLLQWPSRGPTLSEIHRCKIHW